ncbi:unnamed protein product, partial [Mesorhabditis spiculigera]
MTRKEVLVTFILGVTISLSANFQYGFSSTYLNTPVDEFKDHFNQSFVKWGKNLSSDNIDLVYNLISNIWFVGFFMGIWLSPLLNDRWGRRVGFLIGNSFSLLASCLRALSIVTYQPEILFVGRLLASVCTAVTYQSNILYLQEVSPTKYRGFMSFLSEICYAGMALLGMLLGTDQVLGKHLFWLLFVGVPASSLALIALYFLPETPKFLLIVKKDRVAAEKSVIYYHGKTCDTQYVLDEIQLEAESEKDEASFKQGTIDMFTIPHLRRALFLSCAALQNTVALWSLLLNSTQFLQDADVNDWDKQLSKWTSTAMALFYFGSTMMASAVVERAGRRPLLLWFTALNMLSIASFVVFAELRNSVNVLKYGCVFSLIFYGFTYGGAVGPVSWFIPAELVPQRYRSLNQSLSYAINTVSVVATTFTVIPLYNAMGSYAFLVLYTAPSVVCIIYLYFYLPETTGREIHEIVDELKGNKKKKQKVYRVEFPDLGKKPVEGV